ncbi:unannotated protein [freshwater metagenome]|uniref:Unannotated protein n=1 Tax=freshwater metagenome TaxID=449393 RepID=A0A6J7L3F7_9ZZZZ
MEPKLATATVDPSALSAETPVTGKNADPAAEDVDHAAVVLVWSGRAKITLALSEPVRDA